MTISILGAGSWSTAIADLLAEREDVLIYARDEKVVSSINNDHINTKYFPDNELRKNIRAKVGKHRSGHNGLRRN